MIPTFLCSEDNDTHKMMTRKKWRILLRRLYFGDIGKFQSLIFSERELWNWDGKSICCQTLTLVPQGNIVNRLDTISHRMTCILLFS